MYMLEKNHESFEPIDGSFLYPDAIDALSEEKQLIAPAVPILQLADTALLCEAIRESSGYLKRKSLNEELRSAEEFSLDEMLKDLKEEIKVADVIEIDFSDALTSHSSAYDSLLSVYAREVSGDIGLGVRVSVDSITAVHAQPCKASERLFMPRIALRIQTGNEPKRLVIQDGEVTEVSGAPRWFNFPLEHATFRVYEYVRVND
jgi:hypothetical protein